MARSPASPRDIPTAMRTVTAPASRPAATHIHPAPASATDDASRIQAGILPDPSGAGVPTTSPPKSSRAQTILSGVSRGGMINWRPGR